MHRQYADLLDGIADAVARALAPRIAAELRGVSSWIDQIDTPLGRNIHCAAVRRRIATAKADGREPDAAITPKGRYLLSPDALRDELMHPRPVNDVRKTEPEPDDPPDSSDSHLDRLRAKLRRLR